MSDQNFRVVELESIKMEDGAKELMSAPEMQPYLSSIRRRRQITKLKLSDVPTPMPTPARECWSIFWKME